MGSVLAMSSPLAWKWIKNLLELPSRYRQGMKSAGDLDDSSSFCFLKLCSCLFNLQICFCAELILTLEFLASAGTGLTLLLWREESPT